MQWRMLTVQGVLTWPLMLNSFVPWLFLRPKPENHSGPRRKIVGDTATLQTQGKPPQSNLALIAASCFEKSLQEQASSGSERAVVAHVSTLVTVVGQPYRPTLAGNGGFNRGLPCSTVRRGL